MKASKIQVHSLVRPVKQLLVRAMLSALLFQFAGRYVYNYRITNFGIEIVMFSRFPLKRIAFSNISEIKISSSLKEMLPFKAVAFGNRIWGQPVLVHQKKGIFRTIFITPDNSAIY
jgi:hypothetical protein